MADSTNGPLDLVATCALGLEELLEDELRELGVGGIARDRGAVTFRGSWRDCWRANLRLRTANRVLVELATFNGHTGEALEAGARNLVRRRSRSWGGIDAGDLFHPDRTFALQATSSASELRDTRWVVLKVKDGLVDGQRDRFGRRGSVSRTDPDTPLRVLLRKNQATLLLDTSGEPLDRRGYRTDAVEAPLRENLAAACVLASGWDGRGPVLDPMCGSGTLLAEAGLWALGRAPGAVRRARGRGWAFESLPGFDARAFGEICEEEMPAPAGEGSGPRLVGVDTSPEAITAARANLERAGLADRAELSVGDAFRVEPSGLGLEPGLLLVNPPYGVRMAAGEGAGAAVGEAAAREADQAPWRRLGDLLKGSFPGWKAVVLAGDPDLGKWIGLQPDRRLPVRNGPLEARILVFEIWKGSRESDG